MSIRVGLIQGKNELLKIASEWRGLTAKLKSRRHIHLLEWYLALAETWEQHGLAPLHCAVVYIDDTLVTVFPHRTAQEGIGSLSLRLKQLVSDESGAETVRDFIMLPELAEKGFFEGFVTFMARHDPTWEVLDLRGILEDSCAAVALKNSPQLRPYSLTTVGGYWGSIEFVSCGERDRPFERLSKGFRQNLRTAKNKLKDKHVTFEVACAEDTLAEAFPILLNVEDSGWKGEAGTSVVKRPTMKTFLRQLIVWLGASGRCEIHIMRVDGKPIAALLGIVTDGVWYIFKIGYDETYHLVSPGHLILENILKSRAGPNPFSSLSPYNAPPWFRSWKPDRSMPIVNTLVFRSLHQAREVEALLSQREASTRM